MGMTLEEAKKHVTEDEAEAFHQSRMVQVSYLLPGEAPVEPSAVVQALDETSGQSSAMVALPMPGPFPLQHLKRTNRYG